MDSHYNVVVMEKEGNQINVFEVFFNYSIELLEIVLDGRAFHYLAVVVEKLFANVLDECLI